MLGTVACPRSATAFALFKADIVDISRRTEDFIANVLQRPSNAAAATWRTVWSAASDRTDADVWATTNLPSQWNDLYQHYHVATMTAIPPFVTVLGPSVLCAPDGTRFYSPDMVSGLQRGDVDVVESLRVTRRRYLESTFAASTAAPSNYPLHVTVRAVMLKRFPDDLEYKVEHAAAVMSSLLRSQRQQTGNLYTRDFGDVVEFAIGSFLAARRVLRGDGGALASISPAVVETGDFVPFERLVAVEVALLSGRL